VVEGQKIRDRGSRDRTDSSTAASSTQLVAQKPGKVAFWLFGVSTSVSCERASMHADSEDGSSGRSFWTEPVPLRSEGEDLASAEPVVQVDERPGGNIVSSGEWRRGRSCRGESSVACKKSERPTGPAIFINLNHHVEFPALPEVPSVDVEDVVSVGSPSRGGDLSVAIDGWRLPGKHGVACTGRRSGGCARRDRYSVP
jgi:hypothetical protein